MLASFLDSKPLYYDTIDYTRMPRAYESIKEQLKLPKIIHVVGTNGKGTTGRFLAQALYAMGHATGHYTSPHILQFNERIWLNGKHVDSQTLEDAHQKLQKLLSAEFQESLSYFEYTTLLALLVYESCDYVVLEAGLGGEHDATAVFDTILTLITPIDKDHEAFLGDTITSIATTKLKAIKKHALLAHQNHPEVYEVAQSLAKQNNLCIQNYNTQLTQEDEKNIDTIAKTNNLPEYLQQNLALSIAALKHLGLSYKNSYFHNAQLFGRATRLSENIILDVGHNTLAARALKQTFQGQKFVLIYNSYKDKNYSEILTILQDIILRVALIEVQDTRIETKEKLQNTLQHLAIPYEDFQGINPKESYLVFGSFSVAEAFLRHYYG